MQLLRIQNTGCHFLCLFHNIGHCGKIDLRSKAHKENDVIILAQFLAHFGNGTNDLTDFDHFGVFRLNNNIQAKLVAVKQILSAGFIHSHQIIHRDLLGHLSKADRCDQFCTFHNTVTGIRLLGYDNTGRECIIVYFLFDQFQRGIIIQLLINLANQHRNFNELLRLGKQAAIEQCDQEDHQCNHRHKGTTDNSNGRHAAVFLTALFFLTLPLYLRGTAARHRIGISVYLRRSCSGYHTCGSGHLTGRSALSCHLLRRSLRLLRRCHRNGRTGNTKHIIQSR